MITFISYLKFHRFAQFQNCNLLFGYFICLYLRLQSRVLVEIAFQFQFSCLNHFGDEMPRNIEQFYFRQAYN